MLPVPHPAVVYEPVDGGAILLHREQEVFFGLNAAGAKVWQLLPPECVVLDQLCREVERAFPGTDAGVIWDDILELLDALVAHELILPRLSPRSDRGARRGNGHDSGRRTAT